MTPREQIALFLFTVTIGGLGILGLLDYVWGRVEREKQWRLIEMRCSRERHPSFQVSVFDQDRVSVEYKEAIPDNR